MSKKFVVPSQSGRKGLPPGVGASKAPKKGIISPSQFGSKGKPGKAGFPGGKAALD